MEINNKTVFFAGSGNMAQSIIAGIINSGAVKPENIICNDVIEDKLCLIREKYGVKISSDKKDAASADIILFAVKPQHIPDCLCEIKPFIKKDALIISIAAGITTEYIEKTLGTSPSVIRIMPNTPALVGAGVAVLCPGKYASQRDLQTAETVFSSLGIVKIMTEDKFDAVTALSGSGPAYVFYLCELMQKAGENLGLDKETAKDLAAHTVFGAGKMLTTGDADAVVLRKNVTSPNGTTQAALEYFDSKKLSDIVLEAMKCAAQRSKELSK